MSDSGGLCAFPAAIPPDGVKPNFVDPETLAPVSIAVCTLSMTAAFIFTAGRLFANRRKLAWSDCEPPGADLACRRLRILQTSPS